MPIAVLLHRIAAVFGCAVLLLQALPGAAQTAPGQSGGTGTVRPPSETRPVSFSDDELKAFAKAALEVRRLRGIYIPQVDAAEDAAQKEKVGREAAAAFDAAIANEGLSPQLYDSIFAAAQSNEAIAERINRYLNAAQ